MMMVPTESSTGQLVMFHAYRTDESTLIPKKDNKIVGVRYYNGVATTGEVVLCRREADNEVCRRAFRTSLTLRHLSLSA